MLTHDANGDACEAWITREIRFDLAPLQALHPADRERIVVDITRSPGSGGMLFDYVF